MFMTEQDVEQEGQRERNRFWLTVCLGAVLAGVVLALVLLLLRASEDYDASLASQSDSLEVISELRALDASFSRAEAALGRFAVGLANEDGLIFDQQWRRGRAYLNQIQRDLRDDPEQSKRVEELRSELDKREKFLFDVALSANYHQTLAAISKYHAAGLDDSLLRIDRKISQIIAAERRELRSRHLHTRADRANLTRAIWMVSLIGAAVAILAIGALFSLIRANGERRIAESEQQAESERASALEAAVNSRTMELADANAALRKEMTEREAAEQRLRQSQKMEAVGQLTGGIAHDFNNMLAVVIGGLELAQRWLTKDPAKAERQLTNAMDGVNRAADLTRRLLTFARAEPARPEHTPIDDTIAAFAPLLERTIGEGIELELDLHADGAHVVLDKHQFENALLNLAVNSRDAMQGSGQLTIRTVLDQQDDAASLAIQVIDTGCGMSEAMLQRIFDPFFTTKPSGQGTGLGMSQVFAFCRQSGGEVRVQSSEGNGTSVAVILPMADASALPRPSSADQASATQVRRSDTRWRLLLVEDDPRVRAATAASLQELGHDTLSCADPLLVEDIIADHGPFDLVITDMLMPGLTGAELANRVLARWPDQPILFVTGYAGDAAEFETVNREDVLRKPFTLAELDQAVRSHIRQAAI
jgi:signal transduction histidine kinase/ActR/RegA family two-component response regulator